MSDDPTEVRASPILPVTDLDRALAHYAALGFLTSRWSEDYGFAAWHGLELHLSVHEGHDPLRAASAVFLHVPDPDAVPAQWSPVGIGSDIPLRTSRGRCARARTSTTTATCSATEAR